MGQYYKVFNLDRTEKLRPHAFGDGTKLMEFGCSAYGTLTALAMLLHANSNSRGPWVGTRLVVGGDYADEGRFVPPEFSAINLYRYDRTRDAGAADDDSDEDYERFVEQSETATALAQQVLPQTSPFLNGRGGGALARLFEKKAMVDNADDLFALFDLVPGEDLRDSVSDIMRCIRCGNLTSRFSWNYEPSDVRLDLTDDGQDIKRLSITYERTRGTEGAPREQRDIVFPASTVVVRDALGITNRTMPAAREI